MDKAAFGFLYYQDDIYVVELRVLFALFFLVFQAFAVLLLFVRADAAVDDGAFAWSYFLILVKQKYHLLFP